MNKKEERRLNRKILLRAVLECIYPRRCPFCGRVIGFQPECKKCRKLCQALELRDASLDPATHYFGNLSGAAAVYRYKEGVRDAVLGMKYHACRYYARDLGEIMAKTLFGCTFYSKYGIILPEPASAGTDLWDVIVPVPKSSWDRGYNVPALLAQPIAWAIGVPIQDDALKRIRSTHHQAGLPLQDRLDNAEGAFAPSESCHVKGMRVLLIDDVITTGATAAACAEALLSAGAESVYAIALASSQWQTEHSETV